MNPDGTGERRVTTLADSGNSLMPRWSPDGRRIAFHRATPSAIDLFLIDPDGSNFAQLTHKTESGLGAAYASWSPDGKEIAFNSANSPNIFIANVDSGATRQLASRAVRPDWSPMGRRIAFGSGRDGSPQIYVMELDDPDHPIRLTTNPPGNPSAANQNARWAPDGKTIAFESTRDGNREIYVMNADGTGQVRLTTFPGPDAAPSWSPDGKWIVFHRQVAPVPGLDMPNGSDLFAVAADGAREVRITCKAPGSFSAFASWARAPKDAK
jgi:Tol biopolymer transport system component